MATDPVFADGTVECGCCFGLEWGGDEPRECRTCGGTGLMYRYESGVLAQWRGGPLAGRDTSESRHHMWGASS